MSHWKICSLEPYPNRCCRQKMFRQKLMPFILACGRLHLLNSTNIFKTRSYQPTTVARVENLKLQVKWQKWEGMFKTDLPHSNHSPFLSSDFHLNAAVNLTEDAQYLINFNVPRLVFCISSEGQKLWSLQKISGRSGCRFCKVEGKNFGFIGNLRFLQHRKLTNASAKPAKQQLSHCCGGLHPMGH